MATTADYTDPPSQGTGNTIDAAEWQSWIFENLEHFARRPVFWIYFNDDLTAFNTLTTGSASDLEYIVSTGIGGAGTTGWRFGETDNTRHSVIEVSSAVTTAIIGLDDTWANNGLWLAGAEAIWDDNATGRRRLRLLTEDGTVYLNTNVSAAEDRNTATSICGPVALGSDTNDYWKVEGLQNSGSTVEFDSNQIKWWGWRMGKSETVTGFDFVYDRFNVSDTALTCYTALRKNVRALERPVSARISVATQSPDISRDTWTSIDFDTVTYENRTTMADAANDYITVPVDGFYYIEYSVGFDSTFDGNRAQSAHTVNGTRSSYQATIGAAANGQTRVEGSIIQQLAANDQVGVDIYYSGGSATRPLDVGARNHVSATLVSGLDQTMTGRQWFFQGLPEKDPDITEISSDSIPRGLLNAAMDISAFLYQPPVISRRTDPEDFDGQAESATEPGWHEVPMPIIVEDNYGYYDHDAQTQAVGPVRFNAQKHNQGLGSPGSTQTVPFGGMWLVTGAVEVRPDNADGDTFGEVGDRGIRIRHGGKIVARKVFHPNLPTSIGTRMQISGIIHSRIGGEEVILESFHNCRETKTDSGGDTYKDPVDLRRNTGCLSIVWIRKPDEQ